MVAFPYFDVSIYAILRRFGIAPIPALPVLLAFGGLFAGWLVASRRRPAAQALPGLCAWLFLSDLFLPATCYSYHDVAILNVILCGIATAWQIPAGVWFCLLALPLDWAVYAFHPIPQLILALPATLYALGAFALLFDSRKDSAIMEIPPSPETTLRSDR
jgi:hypothetical protein